jgi:hypothetical protein
MRIAALLTSLLAGATLAGGCSESTAPVPDQNDQLTADVAVVAADAVYEDVGMLYLHQGVLGVAAGDLGRMAGWREACPFEATSQRFVCPEQTRGPLTLNRSYAFADAAGVAQGAYDPASTASANVRSTVAGALARDLWTATIDRRRDFTVSGLAGQETQHIVNGVGSSTITRSQHGDGAARTYAMSDIATFTDVVVPFPRTRGAWPISGTIRRVVTIARQGDAGSQTRERIATVTFNGTRFAQLVVGERTFVLDLATGRIVRPT